MNASFKDDKHLNRTKEYTWTTHILRTFHNSLTNLIEAWAEFRAGDVQIFFSNTDENVQLAWQAQIIAIDRDIAEMRFYRRCLVQKIEMFDSLKNGVRSFSFPRTFASKKDIRQNS